MVIDSKKGEMGKQEESGSLSDAHLILKILKMRRSLVDLHAGSTLGNRNIEIPERVKTCNVSLGSPWQRGTAALMVIIIQEQVYKT